MKSNEDNFLSLFDGMGLLFLFFIASFIERAAQITEWLVMCFPPNEAEAPLIPSTINQFF